MYLGVDVGGSKTLVAFFSEDGKIEHESRILTNHDYQKFLASVADLFKTEFGSFEVKYCVCAAPGMIDREKAIGRSFGNLPWLDVPIAEDLSKIFGCAVLIENDANLAGLGEAVLVQEKYKRVLYITLSTGIGAKIIINGMISQEVPDAEVGHMVLDFEGKPTLWEHFASGHALVERWGKRAADIDDPEIWDQYSGLVAKGLQPLLAIFQPEAVVFGGGVGAHFEKFSLILEDKLKALRNPMVANPPLLKAKRPEEAVIYGCYELARQQNG